MDFVLLPGGSQVQFLSLSFHVRSTSCRPVTVRNARLDLLRRCMHLCNAFPKTGTQHHTRERTNQLAKSIYKFRMDLVTHVEQLNENTIPFLTRPTRGRVQESNLRNLLVDVPLGFLAVRPVPHHCVFMRCGALRHGASGYIFCRIRDLFRIYCL